MNFLDKLLQASRTNNSLVCVGLDPDPDFMPEVGVYDFNRAIIDATADLVCAYKPNLAFYEALGIEGMEALLKTVKHVPKDIPVIADAKRGDIGNTARAYAKALFEAFGFDAATVNPYLGYDSLEPFLVYRDKGILILCRTSNPGAADFQELLCQESKSSSYPLYELVARKAKAWNSQGNIGLVVGATYPEQIRTIRELCPDMPLLIPGIGTQGGDLASSVRYGVDVNGERAIISSSRSILYASKGSDFADAARQGVLGLRDEINRFREAL